MKIKVCGMKNPQNIKQIAYLNPDMMGFIFYEKSDRYVDEHSLKEVIQELPSSIFLLPLPTLSRGIRAWVSCGWPMVLLMLECCMPCTTGRNKKRPDPVEEGSSLHALQGRSD